MSSVLLPDGVARRNWMLTVRNRRPYQRSSMQQVRLGIIGVGNMGAAHAQKVFDGQVKRCILAALCDQNSPHVARFKDVPAFTEPGKMLEADLVDAVLIATPHFDHTAL